jgi:hypothetical protein
LTLSAMLWASARVKTPSAVEEIPKFLMLGM